MKRFAAILMLFFLLLTGCAKNFVNYYNNILVLVSSALEIENNKKIECQYVMSNVPLSNVDFISYKDELSGEDWEVLTEFFPVLIERKIVLASHCPNFSDTMAPFEEQRVQDFFSTFPDPPDDFMLSSFAMCDVTGNGQKEIVLYSDYYGGWYWVLHREKDTFYGVYMPVRWFQDLQENGIHLGSGGAAVSYYNRLYFEDGIFRTELLGNTDGQNFFINGNKVGSEEFNKWLEELLVGEVIWYHARTF